MKQSQEIEEVSEDFETSETSSIRNGDDPLLKEKIMSQLFGEFIGFLKSKNLSQGNEYEFDIRLMFQCSKKVLWIDQYDEKLQITVYLNSITMTAEFGVVEKETKNVLHRNKLENLRYNISTGSNLQLTDGSSKKYEEFFKDFVKHFETLKKK